MTLSFSYLAPLINFKVSYKDSYKKRATFLSGEPPRYRFASTLLGVALGDLPILWLLYSSLVQFPYLVIFSINGKLDQLLQARLRTSLPAIAYSPPSHCIITDSHLHRRKASKLIS